ncbi:ABC transporter ATP-binding protein [Clostridia bacterium]|nr:ABC transporter ATP-binding protein [Clostridia bacterium]
MSEEVLRVQNLKKSFGGIRVLEDVDFSLRKGEFKTIIGPNGAGKTTIYNIVSGVMKPTSGKIFCKGQDITGLPPYKIANLGLSRSFQITNLFPDLTVLENVRIAAQAKGKDSLKILLDYKHFKNYFETANKILTMVHLTGKEDLLAKDLSHAEKRKLEMGILLAMGGDILLFDEPTAGLSAEEVPELFKIIEEIKDTKEKSILLIEHKINIILGISDTIAVLQNGVLIGDDTPEKIQQNQAVQDAYFGGGAVLG